MGDMNAKVGKEQTGTTTGNFGLGDRNERGERLVEISVRNKLVITNTWYLHPERRKHTWKSPGEVY